MRSTTVPAAVILAVTCAIVTPGCLQPVESETETSEAESEAPSDPSLDADEVALRWTNIPCMTSAAAAAAAACAFAGWKAPAWAVPVCTLGTAGAVAYSYGYCQGPDSLGTAYVSPPPYAGDGGAYGGPAGFPVFVGGDE